MFAPTLFIPNLNAIADAGNHDFCFQSRKLLQEIGDQNSSYRIHCTLNRPSQHEAVETAGISLAHRQTRKFFHHLLPLLDRIDEEAGIESASDDHLTPDGSPESGRHRNSLLGINSVSIFADEHKK